MRRAIKRRMKGESRRQWIERNLHDSEVGIVLDVIQCWLSFIMVISIMRLNWTNPDTNFTTGYIVIDTINLLATLANLGLRFYSASNRKSFLSHWLSVVEIICVIPLLVEFVTGTTNSVPNTYAFRLLMMLRVMRLLQFYRLLRLAKAAKLRQGLLICLTTLCIIMCAAIFMQTIEYCDPDDKSQVSGETCQDMTFLDAIYFVCITIGTVGFGDVAPKTNLGKAFDVALIFFAGGLVPIQISGYSYILSRETAFDKKYDPDKTTQHVLLCGEVENGALLFFLHNWLYKDEDRRTRRKVVILAPTLPSNNLRRVLLHPDYEERVIYLQGSAMVGADLQRAAAPTAEFCFVMVKKHSGTLDQNDTAANLITCSVRKNNRHAPLHVQVSKLDNTRHFHISGATAVICLEQLKLAFFGKCMWIRGLNPFLGNLIQKFTHAEESRGYWLSDYLSGCEQKICEASLPPFLLNMPSYATLAVLIYREFGVPIVGLRTIEDTTSVYPVDEELSDANFLSVFFIGRGNDISSKIEKLTPAVFVRHPDIAPAALGVSANRNIRTVANMLSAAIEYRVPFARRVSVGFGRDRRTSATPVAKRLSNTKGYGLSMFSGRALDKIAPVDREEDNQSEPVVGSENNPPLAHPEENRLEARHFSSTRIDSGTITPDENYSLGPPSETPVASENRPSKPNISVIALTPAELVIKATTPRGRSKDPIVKPLSSRLPASARSARSTRSGREKTTHSVTESSNDRIISGQINGPTPGANDYHASNWEPAPLQRPSVATSGHLRSRVRHLSLCFRRDPPPLTLSDHYVVCGTPSNYEDFLANLCDLNEKISGVIFISQRMLTEKDLLAQQMHERLYFVRGSPLSMQVFHSARMFYARSILIISYCGMESTSSLDLENDLDENMADVDAITTHRFISEALQNEVSRQQVQGVKEARSMPFIVAEMIRPSNVKFLIDRSGSLFNTNEAAKETRQRDLLKDIKFLDSSFFSPLYTSGNIYFSNIMDALMGSCSNQQLLIEMMTQLVISGNMSMKMPNRVQRSRHRLTQIPAPERYHFRPYALLSTMTLGVYRSVSTSTSPQYVFTNPPSDELVTPQDLLFVIK
ncbi:Voltage-gated Ion Channel [Phytophthora megakarya]|uniref:Voltage-gated Ion Channel n=1 Tax=Phytophthora megakarya TaxID=4795 RepID=A0A225VZ55_9STRA|nr:Voltage-gated Ion Channel [Phytophthora megakarya]